MSSYRSSRPKYRSIQLNFHHVIRKINSVEISIPSVLALTVVNILQMSLHLYMLFIPDIKCTVFKIICVSFSVHNSFPIHFGLSEGVKFLKFIVTGLYCTKYNETKYFKQLYESMFRIQDHTKNI